LAQIDVVRETDHASGVRVTEQKKREADAREDDEEDRREEEDRDGKETGGEQEAATDHPATPQDARDVDREPCPIARALPVVALDLAAEVAQHQGAGRHDQESEEADSVSEPTTENCPRDEMKEREDDDLLIVSGTATGRKADDLEERGELDSYVEGGTAEDEAGALHEA
jgi:hypothetical protein